ncbi:MAG: gamma-glutamyl-gamma-aminobutyrate hydrolase family protein [Actinophytocola sp.]|nr:gamma-glutamyl-gamma-aminobutyrate hydrolase family protein [Actinophytocola sp.]
MGTLDHSRGVVSDQTRGSKDFHARPRIGVTTYLERASYGVWDQESAVLPRSYVDAVVAAAGAPVLLPPLGGAYASLVAGLDGLVLSGGADIDPSEYGQQPHEKTVTRPGRDTFELELLREALRAGLPVLGVCRGFELLNVAFGGTLTQHLPDVVGHTAHQPAPALYGTNRITLAPGSRVAALLGAETKVRCYHHQAIDELGGGLTATGWADDGTIEAIESTDAGFVLGVQWHPEEVLDDPRLFRALVTASRKGTE